MIGRLTGDIETLDLETVLVDVQGVAYEVNVPTGLTGRLEADGSATLYIHTSVRDDAIDLYGFRTLGQRRLFERLTSVSRIGPKTALRVLSDLEPSEIIRSVRSSSTETFETVKGVGEKTAQRLILELKDSLNDLEFEELAPPETSDARAEKLDDLRSALGNFGYSDDDIDSVIETLDDDIDEADEIEPLIRRALDMLK